MAVRLRTLLLNTGAGRSSSPYPSSSTTPMQHPGAEADGAAKQMQYRSSQRQTFSCCSSLSGVGCDRREQMTLERISPLLHFRLQSVPCRMVRFTTLIHAVPCILYVYLARSLSIYFGLAPGVSGSALSHT